MGDKQETQTNTTTELPMNVFEAWHKPGNAISPVAIIATVDSDRKPRTAPYGSLRAITPRLLRLCSLHDHDTYANLRRNGQVSVSLLSPPDIVVSVRGRARVVKQHMIHDENFAVLEIDVGEVKNDMAYGLEIDSAITISAQEQFQSWYEGIMKEMDRVGS